MLRTVVVLFLVLALFGIACAPAPTAADTSSSHGFVADCDAPPAVSCRGSAERARLATAAPVGTAVAPAHVGPTWLTIAAAGAVLEPPEIRPRHCVRDGLDPRAPPLF